MPLKPEMCLHWPLHIKDSKGSKYSFNFPQLEVMEANHPDGGDDIITLDINFAQVRTAPTIVRALV